MSARFLALSSISPTITLEGLPPVLPDWVTLEVDRIWEMAISAEGARLFDGKALFVASIEENRIDLFSFPYRFLYAQSQSTELKQAIDLKPIAVCGACLSEGFVLVGKRANTVTQYPGFLELVPSGGLENLGETLDYKSRLIEELEEETTIKKESILRIDTIGICFDQKESTYDICCTIMLPAGFSRQPISSPTDEYTQLSWQNPGALLKQRSVVPTSLSIIDQLKSTTRQLSGD